MTSATSAQLPKPDWLMLGVPRPGRGIRLYATKDLPRADFDQAVIDCETVWEVSAQMRHMLVIDEPTYPQAIARLFEIWQNQEQAAIEGKRTLPGGSQDVRPSAAISEGPRSLPPGG